MIESIKNFFLVKLIRKVKYERKFKNNTYFNLFKGVYNTFEEAECKIPQGKQSGYNNEDSANMYKHLCQEVFPSDYPNMLWFSKILKDGSKVFDLGGHIGMKYYSYQKYIDFPKEIHWVAQDLPAVIKEGKRWAKENNMTNLSFTADINDFDGVDVLFASGSLQYIDYDIAHEISKKEKKPNHIIVSIPLTELDTFYSVNNIGTAFCVYVLRNENKFIKDIQDQGYQLVDKWINEGKRCEIPFYPEHSIEGYKGLYFKRL